MTGLWGHAMDAEVAYRQAEVRKSHPRRRAARARPSPRPAATPVRRAVTVGVVGLAAGAAGMLTASGRR